jgi:hypothetical protein
MRPAPRRLALATAVAVSLTSRFVLAEPPDPVAAETSFRLGRASADAGDYSRACVQFAESLRLDPAPGTLLNLADCEEHLGRFATAWESFLRLGNIVPVSDERSGIARERAAALAPRVPWIAVTLAPDTPADARIFRDDVEIERPRLSAPWPVDPGWHGVLVVAPGHESRSTGVVAAEGLTVHVVASAGPLVPHELSRPPPSHTAAWVIGAGGLVSLGVGTYFGARAVAERSMSDATCSGGVCGNAAGLGEYESSRSDARIADVALGVGFVALAVTGYLLVTSGSEARAVAALRMTGAGVGGAW